MSRADIDYSARVAGQAGSTGFNVDQPVAGFYRMRLRSGGALCGIRIWYGAPHDPLTGEELDRSHRWQAHCNGEYVDLERVWPQCGRMPITEVEYKRHCQKQAWAREALPTDALANPTRKADPLSTPMMF